MARTFLPRIGGLLLVASAGTLLAWPSPASAAPVTSDPAAAAAGWLSTRLVDGDHIEVEIDLNGDGEITDDERFPDYGLTADTVLALAAAGVGGESIEAATDYLAANVEAYVGDGDTNDDGVDDPDGEYYAGALAKTLLVTAVTGRDGTDFGGVDLQSRLLSLELPSGRFADVSAFGEFSNNVGQSFAALALVRTAPDLLSPAAAAFLSGQQCTDGSRLDGNVPVRIGGDPCAEDSLSIDTTSFATQALFASQEDVAAQAGIELLLRWQDADGRFSDMGVYNANSTGLGAQALRVGGEDEQADRAVSWLLTYQLDCAAPAEQQGAIAFTSDDLEPVYDDRAARSTAQALPGLVGVGLLDITADGAAAGTERLDCQGTPTTTPTATATPTASSSSPPTSSTAPPPTSTAVPSSSPPPGLPNTGTAVGPLLGLGGGSLLVGGGLLLAGRRRNGAHQ